MKYQLLIIMFLTFLTLDIYGLALQDSVSVSQNSNNPLVGTYKSHHLTSFLKSETIIDSKKDSIVSEITFNSDSTFIKITNGKIYKGKYTLTKHHLHFYLCPKSEKCECAFYIRVPTIASDLYPGIDNCDLIYPEDMLVRNKKGQEFITTVYVNYTKVK